MSIDTQQTSWTVVLGPPLSDYTIARRDGVWRFEVLCLCPDADFEAPANSLGISVQTV